MNRPMFTWLLWPEFDAESLEQRVAISFNSHINHYYCWIMPRRHLYAHSAHKMQQQTYERATRVIFLWCENRVCHQIHFGFVDFHFPRRKYFSRTFHSSLRSSHCKQYHSIDLLCVILAMARLLHSSLPLTQSSIVPHTNTHTYWMGNFF